MRPSVNHQRVDGWSTGDRREEASVLAWSATRRRRRSMNPDRSPPMSGEPQRESTDAPNAVSDRVPCSPSSSVPGRGAPRSGIVWASQPQIASPRQFPPIAPEGRAQERPGGPLLRPASGGGGSDARDGRAGEARKRSCRVAHGRTRVERDRFVGSVTKAPPFEASICEVPVCCALRIACARRGAPGAWRFARLG